MSARSPIPKLKRAAVGRGLIRGRARAQPILSAMLCQGTPVEIVDRRTVDKARLGHCASLWRRSLRSAKILSEMRRNSASPPADFPDAVAFTGFLAGYGTWGSATLDGFLLTAVRCRRAVGVSTDRDREDRNVSVF